jgi:hypothetical protein
VCKCVWFPVLLPLIYFCKSLKLSRVFYSVNLHNKFLTAMYLLGNRLLGVGLLKFNNNVVQGVVKVDKA